MLLIFFYILRILCGFENDEKNTPIIIQDQLLIPEETNENGGNKNSIFKSKIINLFPTYKEIQFKKMQEEEGCFTSPDIDIKIDNSASMETKAQGIRNKIKESVSRYFMTFIEFYIRISSYIIYFIMGVFCVLLVLFYFTDDIRFIYGFYANLAFYLINLILILIFY